MNADDHRNDAITFQQLTIQLHWAAQRRLMRALETYHLTLPQFMALRTIHRSKSGSCSMTELSEASYQVMATTSGIISRLSERNLIVRQRDPLDGRSQRVSLTEEGLALVEAIDRDQIQRIEAMFRKFSAQEKELLLSMIEKYLLITIAEMEEKPDESV